MGWSLSGPKTTIRWSKRRVFGRNDFPEEGGLSRKHFEVIDRKGRIYVQDLNSRNGTFIYGQRVKPGEAIEIQPGDSVKVGETKFTLAAVEDFAPIWVDFGLFAIAAAITLAEPSSAWGASLGLLGLAMTISVLLIAFVAAAMASNLLFIRALGKFWDTKTYALHAATVLAGALALNQAFMGYASKDLGLGEAVTQAKIEYFCLAKFNYPRCTRLVGECAECVLQIESWKREMMLEKIKQAKASQSPARVPAAKSPK